MSGLFQRIDTLLVQELMDYTTYDRADMLFDRPALTIEHITRLGDEQAPDGPTGRGWKLTVDGARLEDRHSRRGRNRPALSGHWDARRPRDRAGVCRGVGNPYLP
jgi:hypothetical protein